MFEQAMRRSRGMLVAALIAACAMLILLGQPLWQPAEAHAAPSDQAKPTTHPVAGREDCAMCHKPGGGVSPMPADHAGRPAGTCLACHKPQAADPAAPAPVQPAAPAAPAPKAAAPPAPTAPAPPATVTTAPASTAPAPTAPAPRATVTTAPVTTAPAPAAPAPAAPAPAAPAPAAPGPAPVAQASGQPGPTTHPVQGREDCASCHPVGAGLKPSPADHTGRGNESCLMCHKPSAGTTTKAAMNGAPKVDLTGSSEACRVCHDKPEFQIVSNIASRPDTVKQLEEDRVYAHRFVACITCHTTDPHRSLEPVTKSSIAEACGKCHANQLQEHDASIHGQSLASGGRDAATCIDCHSTQGTPHSIARVLSPDSPAYRSSIASTCAKCHSKIEVMARYDVPTEVYKTYMTTFHGKANVLSPYEITQHPKATCVNCHGYHDIKGASDPTSPVNHDNLATTCGGCHPGAGEQFAAGWLGHKEASPQQFPVVYFAERFFFFFTSSVLTFGILFMVALELGSWILRRKPMDH